MPTIFSSRDLDLARAKSLKLLVIGYGNQGKAHALNANDQGFDVKVGLRQGSPSWDVAQAAGLAVTTLEQGVPEADLISFCLPDLAMPEVFSRHVAPFLQPGHCLVFAHGFNIVSGQIDPPSNGDVVMVSPSGPGHQVRDSFLKGRGLNGVVAVHQDITGDAWFRCLAYSQAMGCLEAGVVQTTFREETESDLFGEQVVLCGGVPEIVKAGFETLVTRGYQPEVAYLEVVRQVKLLVDLMHDRGLDGMRAAISDTARYGSLLNGKRVVGEASRQAMSEILDEIQNGAFARRFLDDAKAGGPEMKALQDAELQSPLIALGEKQVRKRLEGV
ncbi:MAG: ketol-acid reductoisomerase [Fimbriimonadaceae bacterium]|jgi:ketol-acid reductoisomerase|nr:ketol-acid reductoisomerase [Fimbriimonadaceae bacterium]